MTPLQIAARELIDRQTPGWVNTEPTSRSIEMLRKALEAEQAQETRTALEQYDLDQSADYQKGWNDGRIKGYEVGHRYATEAKQARAVACGYDETVGLCTSNPCCYQHQPAKAQQAAGPDLLDVLKKYEIKFENEKLARYEFGDATVDRELHRRAAIAKALG